MHSEFYTLMDAVCSELYAGAFWHNVAATAFRKISCRGFARFSQSEASGDFDSLQCLQKLLIDNLDYTPNITADTPKVAWSSYSELPNILQSWENSEREFAKTLTKAMHMACEIDAAIYRKLIDLIEEVQGEATRVRMCAKRLALSNYDGHDVGHVNKIMHDHYEANPTCQKADFSI